MWALARKPHCRRKSWAEKHLMEHHSRLALAYVRSKKQFLMERYHLDEDQLESAALMGIVRAVKSFDPKRGNRFSTYAYAAILDNIRKDFTKAHDIDKDHLAVMNSIEEGTPHEAGAVRREIAQRRSQVAFGGFRLDKKVRHPDPSGYGVKFGPFFYRDFIEAPSKPCEIERQETCAAVLKAVEGIKDERLRLILCKRFGIGCDPMTLRELDVMLGVSSARVQQLEKKALARLRRELKGENDG